MFMIEIAGMKMNRSRFAFLGLFFLEISIIFHDNSPQITKAKKLKLKKQRLVIHHFNPQNVLISNMYFLRL